MILNWIKIFVYQLKQNLLFSILNVLGLSIGIAGIVFAILYWNEEQSYNDWNPENEKVFQVICDLGYDVVWPYNVAPVGPIMKANIPELESLCYSENYYFNEIINYKGKKIVFEKIYDTQKDFFSYFPFEFVKGNAKNALLDKSSIALSEDTAKQLFGDEDPINKQVIYANRNLVVRGVYKLTGKSSIEPMAVTNLIDKKLEDNIDQWGNFNFGLLIKLKDPAQAKLVAKKIEDIFFNYRTKRDAKDSGISIEEFVKKNGSMKIILEPLKTARLHSQVNGYPEGQGNYKFLLIMAGLSVLILILSIVNYVNLATANAVKRAKEVGVRKIIGATKGNIVRQFLFETVFITVFAIVLALVIVELALPYYNEFLNKDLIMVGSQFYLQLLLIFITVIVIAGIFPAVYVSNFESLLVLKGNFGRSKNGIWLRNGMLILQFSIASFFIIGSYIVYKQVEFMSTKDLGFKGNQVIDISYRHPENDRNFDRYLTIKQEILKMNGVQDVSASNFSFGRGANSSSGFQYKNGNNIQSKNMCVDFNMIDMMKMKISEGRSFDSKIASDSTSSILVNKAALAQMGEKNPIGKEINWNSQKLKIIGVVDQFHLTGPQEEIPPMVFFHYKTISWMKENMNHIFVKVSPENMETTVATIEKFWKAKVDTEYPFKYEFVDKDFARSYEAFVKQKNLFTLLNGVVILIALFGLFALASYSIERRMKEIAIRKTLGAETGSLLKELSKQYLVFCIIGFAIAFVPTYFILNRWLQDFAFRIDISATPFVIGFIVLCILTILIVLTKAYQATRIDVLKYLKYE